MGQAWRQRALEFDTLICHSRLIFENRYKQRIYFRKTELFKLISGVKQFSKTLELGLKSSQKEP